MVRLLKIVFLVSVLMSCENEEKVTSVGNETQFKVEEKTLENCVHPGLLELIRELEGNHGSSMDLVLEFHQYNGQDYLDVVAGYYNCTDSYIDGFFVDSNRVIIRNADSCSLDLIGSCAYDESEYYIVSGPPHEPTHYSFIIHDENNYVQIYKLYKAILGRVVLVDGILDTLNYRMPWDWVVLPPPPLPDELKDSFSVEFDTLFSMVDEPPVFPGGEDDLQEFIESNIEYPTVALEDSLEGTVYIEFVVEKDGTVDLESLGKSSSEIFNEEALRLAELMPSWTPGKRNGRVVRVIVRFPINFTLD